MATTAKAAGTQVIGKAFIVYGTVKAVAPDGTVRVLGPNSVIYADERIITESDGGVSIMLDGPPASQIDIGRMSDVLLNEDVYAGATPEAVTDSSADAEKIQEAILQGDQPLELDATAAGGNAGTGGMDIARFALDGSEGHVTSGAETTGYTQGTVEPFDAILAADDTPTSGIDVAAVDEDGLSYNRITDSSGNQDGAPGDHPAVDSFITGNLTYDFGNDGPAAVNPFVWSMGGLEAMGETSQGHALLYEVVDGGLTLNAYYLVEGNYGEDSGGRVEVFSVTVTDVATGAYTFELHQPLDHALPGTEDDIVFNFSYTLTDGNGTTGTGSLAMTVDDDSPVLLGAEADSGGSDGDGGPHSYTGIPGPGDGGNTLVNGLGGDRGFGENVMFTNDDSSTGKIDVSSIFPDGMKLFGQTYDGFYINNNGNITFAAPMGTYTPFAITGDTANPMIAPFFADVDTRGATGNVSDGGNSMGSNRVWWDFDPVNKVITITWDDVGYYGSHADHVNAFQLRIFDQGDQNFSFEFRYENVDWTTGDASGGSGGLGGTVVRAGWTAGDGVNYYELPQSGTQADMLALETTSNPSTPPDGNWVFNVIGGEITIGDSSDTITVEDEQLNPATDELAGVAGDPTPDYTDTVTGTIVDNVNWGADGFGSATTFTVGQETFDTGTTVYWAQDGSFLGENIEGPAAAASLLVNSDGTYTYTLLDNLIMSGEDEQIDVLSTVSITGEDADGDPVTVNVTLQVQDDVPVLTGQTITATVDEDDIDTSWSQGTSPDDGNADGSYTGNPVVESGGPAYVSGSLATLVSFGADGGSFSFTADAIEQLVNLHLYSKQTALPENGQELTYSIRESGDYVILTATEPDTAGHGDTSNPVFELKLNQETGGYEFRLYDELIHKAPESGADQNFDLRSGLTGSIDSINFGAIIQAVDGDNDSVTLDGKFEVQVRDDIPEVDVDLKSYSVTHDESAGLQNDDTSSASVKALFASVLNPGDDPHVTGSGAIGYAHSDSAIVKVDGWDTATGADSPALASGYSLVVLDAASGLKTTEGANINLSVDAAGRIIGTVESGANEGKVAFAIAIDGGDGEVFVAQYLSLRHPDTNSDDEDVNLSGKIAVRYSVTDSDGDTVYDQIAMGSRVSFDDDGPSINLTAGSDTNVLLTTHDAHTEGTAFDTAISGEDFSGVFSIGSSSYGADGPGSTTAMSYSLNLAHGFVKDSGLNSDGHDINLYKVGNDIIGSTASTKGGVAEGNMVFKLAVNDSGVVTLTQYQEIDHTYNNDTSAPYDDQYAVLNSGLVKLTATATITDGDGDTDTDSETIDLGGNIRFADDGPLVSSNDIVMVDDDDVVGAHGNADGAGDNDPDWVTGTLHHDFGADGAGSISFASMNGTGGTVGAEHVHYSWSGNTLTATVAESADVTRIGNALFTVEVTDTATGAYKVTQLDNILHTSGDNENNATVDLTYTVKDGDSDKAFGTLTISVDDDTPIAGDVYDAIHPHQITINTDNTDVTGWTTGDIAGWVHVTADVPGDTSATINENSNEAGTGTAFGITSSVDGNVSYTDSGYSNEINYLGVDGNPADTTSEVMIFELQNDPGQAAAGMIATRATVDINVFYSGESSVGNEVGAYTLYLDGNEVQGPTTFTANSTGGNYQLVINGPEGGFDEIHFSARTGTIDTQGADSSDYNVKQITFDLVPEHETGNLMTDGGGSFGADGGHVLSIAGVGGGTADNDPTDGLTAEGQYGGTLVVDPSNGDYIYTPPAVIPTGDVTEVFSFTLIDGDGDIASAQLSMLIDDPNNPPGGAS